MLGFAILNNEQGIKNDERYSMEKNHDSIFFVHYSILKDSVLCTQYIF